MERTNQIFVEVEDQKGRASGYWLKDPITVSLANNNKALLERIQIENPHIVFVTVLKIV